MATSRAFTKGTTALFPGFTFTNYAIDQVTAAAQTREKYIPIYDQIKTISKMLDSNKPEHRFFQEYMVMGGERQTLVGWQDMSPAELVKKIAGERKGLLLAVDFINKYPLNWLSLPSKYSEILTRAAEYIKAREAGKPSIVALEEAGRVTAPFHHIGRLGGGRFGKTLVKSIPFLNPGMQVLAQSAETLNTPNGRTRYGFVTLALTAASIASTMAIANLASEEQKQLYSDIRPEELIKYIWLPSPDKKTLYKVRVPDQMNVIALMANMAIMDKKLRSNYSVGEYINGAMAFLPQQFDFTQPARALVSWIPQILKPGVETAMNVKDFPTIMPLESQSAQYKEPRFRFNETTSPLAKKLGDKLNISPIKLDFLMTGYFGRAFGFLTGKPGIYNPLLSMTRKYYFESGRKIQAYYDMKKKNDEEYQSYTKELKIFTPEQEDKLLDRRAQLQEIDSLMEEYREIDVEKEPDDAADLRAEILDVINNIYEGND